MLEIVNNEILEKSKIIVNKITNSKYPINQVEVKEHDGKSFIHSKTSNNFPIKFFEVDNWEYLNIQEDISIKSFSTQVVSLDRLKILPETDTWNALVITYVKEVSGGNILTSDVKKLKNLLSTLEKKHDVPYPWNKVEAILEFVSSNKLAFLKWLTVGNNMIKI